MRNQLLITVLMAAVISIPCFGQDANSTLPVTTKFPQAAQLYRDGLALQGNVRTGEAVEKWHAAVKIDPEFAMAWALIAANDYSPTSASAARETARQLMPKVSNGEQMMIRWVVSRGDSDVISAIAAANDLTANYPKDKYVLSVVGSWLSGLNQWERSLGLQEKALALDPKYAPALNEAGYVYAHQRDFEKAADAMKRYVELIPNEPNPQDSYAEILRLAGRYEDSLTHYKEALKIMPTFASSQQGLGDTYSLMGDQERARAEYAKCSGGSTELRFSILCRQMAAYSYIRENKVDEARKQLEAFAAAMKKEGQSAFEAEALIAMAFIDKDVASSFADLDRASSDLRADSKVPKADREEILAKILAHKVRIAALAGDETRAQQSLAELDLAAKDTTDPLIQAAWKGAHGTSLYVHKIYDAAIADLQDDQDNPFSEMLLVKAYQASGNTKAAAELKDSVMTLRRLEIDLWMAQQALKS